MPESPTKRLLLLMVPLVAALTACCPTPHGAAENPAFPYREWAHPDASPTVVVIGVHGFNGAAVDYANLGKFLAVHERKMALYAFELRGQGNDPVHGRRGDIMETAQWSRDLLAFTGFVKRRHPHAKIVWQGESMGAAIVVQTCRLLEEAAERPPYDGLVLTSPVVSLRDHLPMWQRGLLRTAARLAPCAKVSVAAAVGPRDLPLTAREDFATQSQRTPWYVDRQSLRLLNGLAHMISAMPASASTLRRPVLLLHGGLDFLATDTELAAFAAAIPPGVPVTLRTYPKSHHLLMYDDQRLRVFADEAAWLNSLPRTRR